MKIATWNINGIKARLPNVLDWLQSAKPDIACLQEIKSIDENFPRLEIEELGYNILTHGQKSFNGVAILSKQAADEVIYRLPGDDTDEQARYMEAVFSNQNGSLRVASLYLPNGNPVESEKYPYKLKWMDRLTLRAKELLTYGEPFVLAGDYNIIPEAIDCYDTDVWKDDALFLQKSREKFRELLHLGLTDARRSLHIPNKDYTFWDFQGGAWRKNLGIRIDHLLLSPMAADLLKACQIDKDMRAAEKPSDHVPIWIDLEW